MSTQYPPLPYRRLKLMANGIWDEVNKAFYPFKTSTATLAAKNGISYFVFSITLQGTNTGDNPVQSVNVQGTINGVSSYLAAILIPASVAAANVNSESSAFFNLCVLCSPGTAVIRASGATAANTLIVYAEVPSDLGWVVIE